MKRVLCALMLAVFGFVSTASVSAQDYIAQVRQIAEQAQQRANMHALQAVQSYRQQTGDYSTPDQTVYEYLVMESRRQNPGWYAGLQQREAAFQQQQAAYRQYANSMLDNSYNSYMQRSNWQHQGHQNYVRSGIWERGLCQGQNGSVYELPYYSGGNGYQAHDGSTFWQDSSGQYYQYDNAGWGYNMSNYGW